MRSTLTILVLLGACAAPKDRGLEVNERLAEAASKRGDWAQAAELVVTDEEREDLAYLQEREERDAEYKRRREQRAT